MVLEEGKTVFKLSRLYESYGYMRFKMSKFEEYDTYVKNKSFLTSDNVITFTDTNGKLMALKPDVTLSIVKNSKDVEKFTRKVYYNENVYRVSGDSHAFKEIMQSGLECIGDVGTYEISEVIKIAVESLMQVTDRYVLDVSHLGIVSAAVEATGISASGKKKLLEYFGSKNACGAEELLDEENASKVSKEIISVLMESYVDPSVTIEKLKKINNDQIAVCTKELEEVLAVVGDKNVRLDFSVINDMRYYNGIVFQGFVKDVPKCVLFGGQYDLLLKKMRRNSRAIGFAVYLDELKEEENADSDVDVLVLFNEGTDVKEISGTVETFRKQGKKVIAEKTVPENMRIGKIVEIK